ncbi:MAG: hypothetical protein ACFFBQ_17005, partial [Promethearchaeota archaeon]
VDVLVKPRRINSHYGYKFHTNDNQYDDGLDTDWTAIPGSLSTGETFSDVLTRDVGDKVDNDGTPLLLDKTWTRDQSMSGGYDLLIWVCLAYYWFGWHKSYDVIYFSAWNYDSIYDHRTYEPYELDFKGQYGEDFAGRCTIKFEFLDPSS